MRKLFWLAIGFSSCAIVPQNRRAALADPIMSLQLDDLEAHKKDKFYSTREGRGRRGRHARGRWVRLSVARLIALLCALCGAARAQSLSEDEILGPTGGFRIDSARVRYTHYDQTGRGYQSLAGPVFGPAPKSSRSISRSSR